jgi:hypothetical protein
MAMKQQRPAPSPDDVMRTLLNTPPEPRIKKAKPKRKKKSK